MSLHGYTLFELNLYALQDVVCCVNIQHDCERASCTGTIEQPVRQERQATALRRSLIQHTDSRSYLLNIFSIHNYAYIASVVPTSLELNNVKRRNMVKSALKQPSTYEKRGEMMSPSRT